MTESPAKKQCVDAEDVKSKHEIVKKRAEERIHATQHLIKVTTEPPVYLNTNLILNTSLIYDMKLTKINDGITELNEFGDKCILVLRDDKIPRETWALFGLLVDDMVEPETEYAINKNTFDDLLMICMMNDLPLSTISETEYSKHKPWRKLQVIINLICSKKYEQIFPETEDIFKFAEYYGILGDVYMDYVISGSTAKERATRLNNFEIIPPLHHAIVNKLAIKTLKTIKK